MAVARKQQAMRWVGSGEPLFDQRQRCADEVAVGIERASAFLMTRQSGEGVGRIYLSGGGSRIPGMVAALGKRMNVETSLVNPFERVPVRPDRPTAHR